MRKSVKKSLFDLSSNQHYGGLNRRFDARVRRLRSMGFYYDGETQIYYHPTTWNPKPKYGLHLMQIMHNDRRSWQDQLASLVR